MIEKYNYYPNLSDLVTTNCNFAEYFKVNFLANSAICVTIQSSLKNHILFGDQGQTISVSKSKVDFGCLRLNYFEGLIKLGGTKTRIINLFQHWQTPILFNIYE